MDKQSWVCTLLIQVSLCFALFFAFNIGGPQSSIYHSTKGRGGSVYLYFLSVRGGSRPLNQQTHLLKQMEKVAKIYRAEFVVNISELGEDDPLMQNGTLHFPALKIPWYTTGSSQGQKREYFLKQIRIPHGQFLDIIGVDTGLLLDDLHTKQSNGSGSNQLHWLTTILGLTDSNWRIVIGFHPMAVCEEYEKMETVHAYEPLHHMFLKFGVNAYLSKQGCDDHYTHEGSIACIRHPDPTDGETYKAPSVNGSSAFTKYMHNGFFLHRISPLEIVSYFINSASEVVFKSTLHQRGKEAM